MYTFCRFVLVQHGTHLLQERPQLAAELRHAAGQLQGKRLQLRGRPQHGLPLRQDVHAVPVDALHSHACCCLQGCALIGSEGLSRRKHGR